MSTAKRDAYIDNIYNIINSMKDSKPIFVHSSAVEDIIENTIEEENSITILFNEFEVPFEERSYAIIHNGLQLCIDQIRIIDDEHGAQVFFDVHDDEIPTALSTIMILSLNNLQFIRVVNVDDNIYEINIETIPSWFITDNSKNILDAFPIVETSEGVEIVNNNLFNVTKIWGYLPAQLSKFLFDIITTPIDAPDHALHDAMVNMTKAKMRNSDLIDLVAGSAIERRVIDQSGGYRSELYRIEELDDDSVKCVGITTENEGMIVNIRYKYLIENNINIIPYYENIFQTGGNKILLNGPGNFDEVILPSGENAIEYALCNIAEAIEISSDIDESKINELLNKKYSGHRIDRKRNSTIKYINSIAEHMMIAHHSIIFILNATRDENVRVYNTATETIMTFSSEDNLFKQEYEQLLKVLNILDVKFEKTIDNELIEIE